MKRVVQRHIDHQQYVPVSPGSIRVGSRIDFDCYIKRYNGYVIIIEAGTVIDEDLSAKVLKQHKIYVEVGQMERYKAYREQFTDEAEAEAAAEASAADAGTIESLPVALRKCKSVQERIELLYRSGADLLKRCFDCPSDENLPLGDVRTYARIMGEFVASQRYSFKQLLAAMSGHYSEAHHSLNVALLAAVLAKTQKFTGRQLEEIALAGLLHDIGKRRVDPEILEKPTELDSDEFEKVREHALFSAQIVKTHNINNPQILSAIRYHHERLDGSGYPNGLMGNQIPVMAQVLAVCDVFDALTTDRTFRVRYSSFEALKLMKKEMGRQINTAYVDHLILQLRG